MVRRFIGKVLEDGPLSLPEDIAKEKTFEVILLPVEGPDIFSYTENLAKEKGFSHLIEKDIEKTIHEIRGVA